MPEDMEIPSKFGNAASYWKYFDDIAHPRNKRMVDTITQNLDVTLVFGALFAGVNATFLGFVLPMLSPDPAAHTNHLLILLLKGGMGQSDLTDEQLKLPEFSPPPETLRLARLLTVSLTLTLLLSVGAMVGKLWMIYYERGPQGGPSERESRVLQRKLAGVYRWGLRLMPELMGPSLFGIALIVFGVGVFGFLVGLGPDVAWINSVLAWIGVAIFAITNFMAMWDPWCPLQTPLSQFALFVISLPFDTLPSIVLGITKRFPKKIIGRATHSVIKSLSWDWHQPYRTIKEEKEIIGNTVDSSYIRTLSHRFEFSPFRNISAKFRRQDESNDVLDAKFTCYLLRKTDQSEVLLSVVQSIPTLFDRKAVSILLADNAAFHLHRLFRASIDQAEDDPNAMVQDNDDSSCPIENAILYGRAIIHLFVALGPHDDWFWDSYETPLSNGWMDSWDLVDEESVSKHVLEELKHQRLIIQASLNVGPDNVPPSMDIEHSTLPLYIAASIKSLLYRRVYHHLAHSLPKYCGVSRVWAGEHNLQRTIFECAFPKRFPKTIGLVAWALSRVPIRRYNHDDPILNKYRGFKEDMEGLWNSYKDTSTILLNVADAVDAYWRVTEAMPSGSDDNSINIKKTYKNMLEAMRHYVLEDCPKQDILSNGTKLLDRSRAPGGLMTPDKDISITGEDVAVRGAMQSVVDAVVVRRGRRLQQRMRSMSSSGPEANHDGAGDLEKEWFSDNTPAALDDYSEWLTSHASPSPDSLEAPRKLFMSTWAEQRKQEEGRSRSQTIDMDKPDTLDRGSSSTK